MQAVLSNPSHPEYGVAIIPFPIPKAEYDNCIFILNALEIGDALAADCKVEEISKDYPILKRLEGACANADELDYLVKRIESFDKRELGQFQAVAAGQNINTIRDFINLTFCCQNVTIVQDFSDLKRIGEFCHMDRNGGTMSQDDMVKVDFEKAALNLLLNEDGKVTPYGVIYDKDFTLEQLYDGRHFPQYRYEDCVMELEVTTGADSYPAYLCLPMSEPQLERAMLRSSLADCEGMELRFMDSSLPEEADALLDFTEESIHDLNSLCQSVADFTESDMAKYRAAVLFAEPTTATELKNLAEQLDLFDFIPDIRTPEEYGKHMICESGHFEYDENLSGYYNFEKYGMERMAEDYGQFNDSGYISYHGVVSMGELLAGVQCERMEMGGHGMRNSFKINFLEQHSNRTVQKLLATSSEQQDIELRKKLPSEASIQMQILLGALDIEAVDSVDDVLRIADSLDNFDFFPDVTTERELGIYLVESDEMDFPEAVRNYLDYERIGTEYHANHSGAFIDTGYVTRQHEQELCLSQQMG